MMIRRLSRYFYIAVCSIIFFISLPFYLYGSAPSKPVTLYQHHMWTVDHGLPMNSVICIRQTPDGYLWLGTEMGLVRFDGVRFRIFDRERTPGFTCDLILCMLVDREGRLWCGTRGGGVLRLEDRSFRAITAKDGLPDNEVWALLETGDGTVWAGTRNGLCCIEKNRDSVSSSSEPFFKISTVDLSESAVCKYIKALIEDNMGRVWVGTRGGGLVQVIKRTNRFETESKGLENEKIRTLFQDRRGTVWAGTLNRGLFKLQDNNTTVYDTSNNLTCNNIENIHEDRAGNLWIATYGGGINVLDNSRTAFSVINDRSGLGSNAVYHLYQDREGTMWAGTDGGGLNSFRDTRIITYNSSNGLSNDIASGVFQDSSGSIWIGSRGFGVSRGYPKEGDMEFQVYTKRHGLSKESINSFAESPGGTLWIGTCGAGINRLDLKSGQISHFNAAHGLTDLFIRALYTDPQGQLWAGADNGGIHRFDNGKFNEIHNVNYRINCLFKDNRDHLWVGTFGGGAVRLYLNNRKKSNGSAPFIPPELEKKIVMCMFQDQSGRLWFGTSYNGLYVQKNNGYANITKKHGLPDETVYCILEDQKQNLWMSTNRGIFCLYKKEIDQYLNRQIKKLQPAVFGTDDGMHGSECNGGNQPPGWRAADGKMWFPTTRGVSVIDPGDLGVNPLPPPVKIENITIDGKSYNPSAPITAPPGNGKLEIRFTALSFIVPKKIRIHFILKGLDKNTREADKTRTASYDNVPPGSYTFTVTACNSDGIWNQSGVSVNIRFTPYFYQTTAFKAGLIIGILAVLAGLYFFTRKHFVLRFPSKKYKTSSLTPNDSETYLKQILHLIKVKRIYRDPNVSLQLLASKLAISPRAISQVINEQLKKNFFELINEHRIEEAQELLLRPGTAGKTILEIAFDVGFNSKSAFNRVFKNFTQMTPSQYRKKAK